MRIPFTGIEKGAKGSKDGKATGPEDLPPEYVEYAPIEIHRHITDIYNTMAENIQKKSTMEC